MKQFALTFMVFLSLSSCNDGDTDFRIPSGGGGDADVVELPSFDFDETPLRDELTEIVPKDDNDYLENWEATDTVDIVYDGGTADIVNESGESIVTEDAHVTAVIRKKNICFRLSGKSENGALKIYSDRRFMIVMNGVELTNAKGAAINSQCGKTMYMVLAAGTSNRIKDGKTYEYVGKEDMKGCMFSEGQVVFSGTGKLDVEAQGRNGIASDDYVVVCPGVVLNVKSTSGNGIKANDGVSIRGGALNIEVTAAGRKGINSELGIEITGGRTIVHTKGDVFAGMDEMTNMPDTTGAAALKCDSAFTMTGGRLLAKSTGEGGKGINSNVAVRILGGTVAVATYGQSVNSSPRAVKSDGDIRIESASIDAYSKYVSPLKCDGKKTWASGYSELKDSEYYFKIRY